MSCKLEEEKSTVLSKVYFYAAIAIAAVCSLLHVLTIRDFYPDTANVYLPLVRYFAKGDYLNAVHPAIPSFTTLISGVFVGPGSLQAHHAFILVSRLFFILSLPILFRILRNFVSPTWAAFGCLLCATAPKLIRYFCMGTLDSTKFFFMLAGFLCLLN